MFERLNATRRRAVPQLRKAKQQAGQARAASSLSAAYRRASRSLSGVSVSPAVRGANTDLVTALEKNRGGLRAARGGRSAGQPRRVQRGA
jgi:hypothetical protein